LNCPGQILAQGVCGDQIAFDEGEASKAAEMAQLTVRNVDEWVALCLEQRAAAHGRSAEAEHREILREVLLRGGAAKESFARRAAQLRRRLPSKVDSAALMRADRDRDTAA
jgi:plasmid stability protein